MQPQVETTDAAVEPDVDHDTVAHDEIRPISEAEKRLRREVARYREQARAAQSERDAACAAAVRERDAAIAAAQDSAKGRVLRAELRSAAMRAGILDLDALQLADTSSVSVGEDGELQGIDEAVSTLKERKPYLFGGEMGAVHPATTTQTQKPPSPSQPVAVDARNLSREAWQAERGRLLSRQR